MMLWTLVKCFVGWVVFLYTYLLVYTVASSIKLGMKSLK